MRTEPEPACEQIVSLQQLQRRGGDRGGGEEGGCGGGGRVSVPGRWARRRVDEADLANATYLDSLAASLQRATMEEEGA